MWREIHELQPYFDWALNESCLDYDECNDYSPFIKAHKVYNQKQTITCVPKQDIMCVAKLVRLNDGLFCNTRDVLFWNTHEIFFSNTRDGLFWNACDVLWIIT
jgi:hypothetical protein